LKTPSYSAVFEPSTVLSLQEGILGQLVFNILWKIRTSIAEAEFSKMRRPQKYEELTARKIESLIFAKCLVDLPEAIIR
jgi:hypothetical protein